jgi:hypothetical protein
VATHHRQRQRSLIPGRGPLTPLRFDHLRRGEVVGGEGEVETGEEGEEEGDTFEGREGFACGKRGYEQRREGEGERGQRKGRTEAAVKRFGERGEGGKESASLLSPIPLSASEEAGETKRDDSPPPPTIESMHQKLALFPELSLPILSFLRFKPPSRLVLSSVVSPEVGIAGGGPVGPLNELCIRGK